MESPRVTDKTQQHTPNLNKRSLDQSRVTNMAPNNQILQENTDSNFVQDEELKAVSLIHIFKHLGYG